MAQTPEGHVKNAVKKVLAAHSVLAAGSKMEVSDLPANGWYYMPVKGTSFGVNGIHDFVGCVRGMFFSLETKAPGGGMTANQEARARGVTKGGGRFFLVEGERGLAEFETWVKETING